MKNITVNSHEMLIENVIKHVATNQNQHIGLQDNTESRIVKKPMVTLHHMINRKIIKQLRQKSLFRIGRRDL